MRGKKLQKKKTPNFAIGFWSVHFKCYKSFVSKESRAKLMSNVETNKYRTCFYFFIQVGGYEIIRKIGDLGILISHALNNC